MKTIFLILLALIYISSSQSFTQSGNEYENARILNTKQEVILANNLLIGEKIYFYKESKLDSINKENINFIRADMGSYWIEGAILGGISGFVIAEVRRNPNEPSNGGSRMILSTLGGAVGGAIGYAITKNKIVFKGENFYVSFLNQVPRNISPTLVNLKIHF